MPQEKFSIRHNEEGAIDFSAFGSALCIGQEEPSRTPRALSSGAPVTAPESRRDESPEPGVELPEHELKVSNLKNIFFVATIPHIYYCQLDVFM